MTIFLVAYSQANAIYEDMLSITSHNIEHDLIKDILYTLIVLILQLITVGLWFRLSRPTIERRYKIHLKE